MPNFSLLGWKLAASEWGIYVDQLTEQKIYLSILKYLKCKIILAMTLRIIRFKVFDWIQACQATSPGRNLLLYVCLMLNLFLIQAKSMADILRQNVEKDREIASLKAELAKLPQKSPVQPRTKRSLLANIREAVTSPRKSTTGRTLRKTVRTQHHWKSQHLHKLEILLVLKMEATRVTCYSLYLDEVFLCDGIVIF